MIFIFEKDMRFPKLLDIYGELLSDRKREILDYYYNDDCSLAEISELTGISRQGVRDAVARGREEIEGYEAKLGLSRKSDMLMQLRERLKNDGCGSEIITIVDEILK